VGSSSDLLLVYFINIRYSRPEYDVHYDDSTGRMLSQAVGRARRVTLGHDV
jgi:hypothetical protein